MDDMPYRGRRVYGKQFNTASEEVTLTHMTYRCGLNLDLLIVWPATNMLLMLAIFGLASSPNTIAYISKPLLVLEKGAEVY